MVAPGDIIVPYGRGTATEERRPESGRPTAVRHRNTEILNSHFSILNSHLSPVTCHLSLALLPGPIFRKKVLTNRVSLYIISKLERTTTFEPKRGATAADNCIWSGIEAVITSTTGNRVYVKSVPRVRIPPTPPKNRESRSPCGFGISFIFP